VAYEIKARSLGELLDGAFQLYRNHFRMFLGATVMIWVPMIILASLINWTITGDLSGIPKPSNGLSQFWMVFSVTVPVYYLARILQDAVVTIAVADAYLGHKVSMKQAFRRAGSVLGPLLGVSILAGIAIWIAFLFLVVPGILLMLNWLLIFISL